jgi:hypothetical protein
MEDSGHTALSRYPFDRRLGVQEQVSTLYKREKFLAHSGNRNSVVLFFFLVCDAIGTAATPGLLCQPRVIVKKIVEKQMECRLAGETEVLGENLPLLYITKSHMTRPEFEPGPPRWEAETQSFSL